jgi:hypothetical protein
MSDPKPTPPDVTGVAPLSCPKKWCETDHTDPLLADHTHRVGRVEISEYDWVTVEVAQSDALHDAPMVCVIHTTPGIKGEVLWLEAAVAVELAGITEALGNAEFASLLRRAVEFIEMVDHAERVAAPEGDDR